MSLASGIDAVGAIANQGLQEMHKQKSLGPNLGNAASAAGQRAAMGFNAGQAATANDLINQHMLAQQAFNSGQAASANAFTKEMWQLAADFNAQEAQKQRDWMTKMSNTAHQREVKDLIKAGLNPVLSAGGQGATSNSGAVATMTGATGQMATSSALGAESANVGGYQGLGYNVSDELALIGAVISSVSYITSGIEAVEKTIKENNIPEKIGNGLNNVMEKAIDGIKRKRNLYNW